MLESSGFFSDREKHRLPYLKALTYYNTHHEIQITEKALHRHDGRNECSLR